MNGAQLLDRTFLPVSGPLVVAVSGGCDSMALWAMLAQAGCWQLIIWHLDHGIRADAAADGELIRACQLPGVRCLEAEDIPARAREWGVGLEAAGRRQRYARLIAVAQAHGATCVVTAHHGDDQAETVLMNLLRGSHGLVGIPATRPLAEGISLVRPVLHVARADLRAFATAQGIPWREDATNRDLRYRRNFIRHSVMPVFEGGCPGFSAHLSRVASRDQRPPAHPLSTWLRARGLRVSRAIMARISALGELESVTLGGRRIVRLGESWQDVAEFPQAIAPVEVCAPGLFRRDGATLQLSAHHGPLDLPRHRQAGSGLIACAAIRGSVQWRSARAGERWRPLGCAGHQSLMATAAAAKVPLPLRAALSVLADDEGPLWLACGTIAERARVTDGDAWHISLQPS
jgi:tRNA(Ile)-lysidine synthetase-like protein